MTEQSTDEGQGQGGSTLKMRYYTPDDVALHNCAEDCWLSLFGQVRIEILLCVMVSGILLSLVMTNIFSSLFFLSAAEVCWVLLATLKPVSGLPASLLGHYDLHTLPTH